MIPTKWPIRAKGKLLIIGGHEDKGELSGENLHVHKTNPRTSHFEILGTLISKIPRAHHVIEIISAASSIEEEMEQCYVTAFKQQGFTKVDYIKVTNKKDAQNNASIKKIKTAHAVFFTGGDQNKLLSIIGKTPLLTAIKNKYFADKNFIVAGTSAGAMALPSIMISHGLIAEALFKKDIKTTNGFGLISNVIVDTHFIKRGRFGRLAHAVALNPTCLGIGLGEDTALLISDGNKAECIGSGMVILVNGSEIKKTNIDRVKTVTPIVIENLIVTILAEGSEYLLEERKFLTTKILN